MAATGRQLKQSVKVFHNRMLYLLLPNWGKGNHGNQTPTQHVIGLTFVVKPVYPVYTGTLVISPQQEEVLRVLDLVGK